MAAVGKKKKKVRAKKSKSMFPVVAGAAVLAYLLFYKSSAAQSTTTQTTETLPGAAATTTAPAPGSPVVVTLPVTKTPAPTAPPYEASGSAQQIQSYIGTIMLLYDTLLYDDSYPAAWKTVFTRIRANVSGASPIQDLETAINELRTAVEYINQNYETGVPLMQGTPLYYSVQAMRAKYDIF